MPKLMIVLAVAVATTLCSTTTAYRIVNINARRSTSGRQRSIALADMSIVHDASSLLDAFQHAIATVPQIDSLHHSFSMPSSLPLADGVVAIDAIPDTGVSVVPVPDTGLYKVDKTGFIGFFANIFEQAIDLLHNIAGGKGNYGIAIVFFTFLIKAATIPLTVTQLKSTTGMQKLQPLQAKILARYPDKEDEQKKNQLLSQLFQAAEVNPLAGCFPALVQIPIFISLYRALQNLIAENKLNEPFLWIPDLEGPVYSSSATESTNWFYSIFSGTPELGWDDTKAFLTLPLILWVSQTISSKILQPPRDPSKPMTEQEQFSQGLVNNLPFIVAFFSLNVPAGLTVYWITNNILTTLVTVAVKATIKEKPLPAEVEQMMAMLDVPEGGVTKIRSTPSSRQMMKSSIVDDSKRVEGFGSTLKAIDVEGSVINEKNQANDDDDDDEDDDDDDDDETLEKVEGDSDKNDGSPKRKRRTKPSKKGGKK